MKKNFVMVAMDIYCENRMPAPVYRVFVDGELFTERAYRADDNHFYQEILQILAPEGRYDIRFEAVDLAPWRVENLRVERGPGRIKGTTLRIWDEN